MKPIYRILSLAALALTILPPVLFLTHSMDEGTMKLLIAVGAVLWFGTAPLWMKSEET